MADSSGPDETALGAAGTPAAAARRESDAIAPGTRVGDYVVEGELGRGGMGLVVAAHHPVIGKRVAIKVLAAELSRDASMVRRFADEARAVNKIGHPNIIDIFGFGQLDDGRQYFAMEYLEGETFADRLARGPLPDDEASRLFGQVCGALEAAHREKIVHRDLKPENLWIARPKHGEPFMKVLDFGIAKLLEVAEGAPITETGMIIGTPHYMAPEQCLGQPVDHRADIYAMGVLLYRVFTGRLPSGGQTFTEIVAHKLTVTPARPGSLRAMPPALDALVMACLEKDPAARPQSAAALGTRLSAALGGAPAGLEETGPSDPPDLEAPPIAQRGRAIRVALLFVVLVAAGLGVIGLLRRGSGSSAVTAPTASAPSGSPPARSSGVPVTSPAVVAPTPPATGAHEPPAPPSAAPPPHPREHQNALPLGRRNPYQ